MIPEVCDVKMFLSFSETLSTLQVCVAYTCLLVDKRAALLSPTADAAYHQKDLIFKEVGPSFITENRRGFPWPH